MSQGVTESLELAFHEAMTDVYRRAKSECGYNASLLLRMVSERGGLATARALINATNVSDGFTELWSLKRLDLAVEYVVLKDRWRPLFTSEELDIARQRLLQYGLADKDLPT